MNPFGQIIDVTNLNEIEPGKAGPGFSNNVNPLDPNIDFLKILGGKLSGELPFLFGEEAESIDPNAVVSDEILSDKSVATLSLNLPDELATAESEESIGQNNLIDPTIIGSEQFLENKTAEAVNNIKTVLSPEQIPKTENLIKVSNSSIVSPKLKIIDLNLNSANNIPAQIDPDNSKVEIRPAVLAEIDKELLPNNRVDLKTVSLIDKVAGSLNIKNVKLEKNGENNQTDKEPIKLALPTKSYIKVTTIDGNSIASSNNKQFADTNQNPFANEPEIVSSENEIAVGEKVRQSNFKAVAGIESDQRQNIKTETGQSTIQTRLISDIAPTLTNNAEKVDLPETKIISESVKFVLPAEINGKNIKSNHTVMIRMEPDHLGPIRMTISTYNDTLTARLVVDSPLAKAMVESNLNNLVEQLDKQGIKVETLEVSVSGGEVGHEAKENRFTGSAGSARQNLKNYKNSNAIDKVMAQRAQEHLYIESNGVNCFA